MTRALWRACVHWKWEWTSLGGDLVDTGHWYAARDKVQHIAGAALLWFLLALFPVAVGWQLAVFWGACLAIELTEGYRQARWTLAGSVGWPPAFADVPDVADLVADAIGLDLAVLYLVAVRLTS